MLKDSFIDLTLCVRVINNGLYFISLFLFYFLFFIFFYFLFLLLLELEFRVTSQSHNHILQKNVEDFRTMMLYILQLKDLRVDQWILGLTQENLIENSIWDHLPYIPKTNGLCSTTLAYPKWPYVWLKVNIYIICYIISSFQNLQPSSIMTCDFVTILWQQPVMLNPNPSSQNKEEIEIEKEKEE